MRTEFIVFCCVAIVAVIGLIVYKKINPESFGIYLVWVLFILGIAVALYRPWRIFV